MTQPDQIRGTVLEQLTNWLTPGRRIETDVQPGRGIRLGQAQTNSIPDGLFYRMRVRPFDPKLIEMFWPDSLARQKGWHVYEEMLDDAQVRSNAGLKRYAPIMNGWDLHPPDDSPAAARVLQLCKDNLNETERTLEKLVGEILISTFLGLSISESLYRYEKSGVYKGKVLFTETQTRPPSVLDVQFDQHGKVTGVVEVGAHGGWAGGVAAEPGLNPFKFVIHTWEGRYGSPYGKGDGRSVYKHWWAKQFLMKSWTMYMDKYGAPSLYGVSDNTMSPEEEYRFLELLGAIQHSGYAVLPDNWKVEWLSAPGGSGNGQAFLTAIEWQDTMISQSILGSTLSTNQPTKGLGLGGGKLGEVHAQTRDLMFAMVKKEAEDIVRKQILMPLVRLNFGADAARYLTPTITFSPPTLEDASDLATIVVSLIQAGVVNGSEPWIRERLHMPSWDQVKEAVQEREKEDAEHQTKVNETKGLNPDGSFTPADPGAEGEQEGQGGAAGKGGAQ